MSAKHPLLPVSVLGSEYVAMKSASLAFMELTFWFAFMELATGRAGTLDTSNTALRTC